MAVATPLGQPPLPQLQQQQQQQQQFQHATLDTPEQVRAHIGRLIAIVEAFPSEVVVPMGTDDDDADGRRQQQQLEEATAARTADERAFEAFVSELPQPRDLLGDIFDNTDAGFADMMLDLGANMDDIADYEAAGGYGRDE